MNNKEIADFNKLAIDTTTTYDTILSKRGNAMSLQDDYFDLSESDNLDEHDKAALERIWNHMVDMENEVERLRPIVNNFRNAISELFPKNEEE